MNIGHGHVPQPLEHAKVLRTPGARIELDRRGEFVVRLPTQTGRFLAWLRPGNSAEQARAHSRDKLAIRYSLDAKAGQSIHLSLREGQILSTRERATNRSKNQPVAEAFIRQLQATTDPRLQTLASKELRHRIVELPPKLFANEVARIAAQAEMNALVVKQDLQDLRAAMAQELAGMPGSSRLPAGKRDELLDHAMRLHNADAAMLASQVQPPESYVERAVTALKLSPAELRERESASAVLVRSVRHSGISHTHVALHVDRFQAVAASLKPDEFRAQLSQLRESVATEAVQSPARLARARDRLQACAEALQPAFDSLAQQQAPRKALGESTRQFEQRERAFKVEYARAVTAQVDVLTERFGESVDRVAADQVFWKEGLRDLAPARLIQEALKHLLADQARAGRSADDATGAAYLNAMLTALNNAKSDPRPDRR